ncbi:nicotinate-nucleotide--dimethylbenzimidazole phosphoribosyltransferase [Companilactobacillus ginsenosidimutans]|uniref:Nicotinate-nucleotide--dimethylbenzimidazole phosphoribosyltransferase n=1 Tax=Companilactobacillus ginsenosidimutans TaxID=1007676 RepID=A0A0H4QJX2_9LACO|nr:nicotinate-nucleotide--dimethylbenzimidazole phosphoribosyltransferase [Companilactobacillus ginsenosidimutans]AKP67361.1 nicotinate-nucleotide--dimethylbenzimidazole phosphoribosyltransferase [Companilactobacillus ginsenosidimutans]
MIQISPVNIDHNTEINMQKLLDGLAKPIAGLGNLEDLAVKIAGIERTTHINVSKRCCLLFAADHGVVEEGVSATPKEVTALQSINSVKRTTTIGVLTKLNHCDLKVTDVGVDYTFHDSRIIDCKISNGTKNMVHEDAMTRDQAETSIKIGMACAKQAIDEGNDILLIGELGIANTSSASAIIAAALNLPAEKVVGRGSNISDERLVHKIEVVKTALKNRNCDSDDAIDILSKVGGFEIGAMAGAIIEAANSGVPIVLDGFLTYSSCILAQKFIPGIGKHVIASHASHELGTKLALEALNLEANYNLDLAVGEGSGAALLLPWLDAIDQLIKNMATLKDLNVHFAK